MSQANKKEIQIFQPKLKLISKKHVEHLTNTESEQVSLLIPRLNFRRSVARAYFALTCEILGG